MNQEVTNEIGRVAGSRGSTQSHILTYPGFKTQNLSQLCVLGRGELTSASAVSKCGFNRRNFIVDQRQVGSVQEAFQEVSGSVFYGLPETS